MNLRAVALVSGVVGGLCWSTRLVLDLTETGGTGLLDALHWAGLVLLAVAMVGFGAGLVSSSAAWLRVIVGIAFPALVWSVLEVFRPAADTEVVDGVFGGCRPGPLAAGPGRRPARRSPLRGTPTAEHTPADSRTPRGMRQTAAGFNHEDPFPEVDVGPVVGARGDDQPAHLPAGPARHG